MLDQLDHIRTIEERIMQRCPGEPKDIQDIRLNDEASTQAFAIGWQQRQLRVDSELLGEDPYLSSVLCLLEDFDFAPVANVLGSV